MAAASSDEGHDHEHGESAANAEGVSCHDHAGVQRVHSNEFQKSVTNVEQALR